MKVTITETKLTKVIHKYINVSFEGFDNCHYDWAEFSCGLGVCCDPYAVGFVLPGSEYNDYLFKLVNKCLTLTLNLFYTYTNNFI